MDNKLSKLIRDNKVSITIILVLWVAMSIVLVSPLAYSIVDSTTNGVFNFGKFIELLIPSLTAFNTFGKIWGAAYIGTFFKCLGYFTVFYAIVAIIGIFKSKPKHEYTDIEHGSSDWSEGGEQYRILSKHKGILLAENNYLPLDKMGNTNVLVVGRFWFW